ncbi:alpha/beta fold hydrolase [Streptomyces hainanensis]|uniref:Alpha/beta hydrolase n=1 Tax=Streptomyces hainanensis TaxID=402648 RepID=A0A4R4TKR8_9ACTN|nr:alpha/beta hydrolase [Streptomyces hainanensis]TDC78437.1 alpha/beta hydrolase [Streptomyces hainanensis]
MALTRPVTLNGTPLSYVDFGGPGAPLLALHGHFGRARGWAALAAALAPGHRLLALEQRAHGRAEPVADVRPDAYLADAAGFLDHLGLGPLPVLGHSMGGAVAYRLAARRPDLVTRLVVLDAPARNEPPVLDPRPWPRRAATLAELHRLLAERVGPVTGYFLENAVEHPDGWGLLFDADTLLRSQWALLGDWWPDWLGSACPALLLHGEESTVLPTAQAEEMAARRPHTELLSFPGLGHWLHDEEPAGVARAVGAFLTGRHGLTGRSGLAGRSG